MKKLFLIIIVGLLSMSFPLIGQGNQSAGSFAKQFQELNQCIDSLQKVVTAVKLESGNKDVVNASLQKSVGELQAQNQSLATQVEEGHRRMLTLAVIGAIALLAMAGLCFRLARRNKGNDAAGIAGRNVDHSLALTVANELTRITQNLSYMDTKTRGLSQLQHRATAIATALEEKGYEIPSLVGTEYREGDNMEVVMEEDEMIEDRRMIIRRVTRPCVLYKGRMIQCAKAVVAYNPQIMSSQEK